MENVISKIAKELEILAAKPTTLGLRDNGLSGITLFFFIYARFNGDTEYEEFAKKLLDRCLVNVNKNNSRYDLASQFVEMGRIINLLAEEKYIEVEPAEFFQLFEKTLISHLRNNAGVDFGFQTGIIGLCDFFLGKSEEQEALDITLGHIYSGLGVKGYPKHPIESQFLFPSEILRDVKIFFLKLEKLNIPVPQKELLEQAIQKLESKRILQSNCPEYNILQDLREAEIMKDRKKIQSSMQTITLSSSNLTIKGLACMSLENENLSSWRKLV